MTIIDRQFFSQHSVSLARNILGQTMCVKQRNGLVYCGKIAEAEAYRQEEPSCHAFCSVTKRSETLFLKEGTIYVYMIYGMYNCVNVVSEKEGYGSAVLIRALEPVCGFSNVRAASGPGKICKVMNITREFNGLDAADKNSPIWFEYAEQIPDNRVVQTTRIGIKKACELPWRFYIKDSMSVSKK